MGCLQAAPVVKNPPTNAGDMRRGFDPWVRKMSWRQAQQSTSECLPRESPGQRSLLGYSLQGCKELDMTKVT